MAYLVDLWKAEWCIKTQLVRSAASRLGSKSIPTSGSEAETMPACQSCLVLSVGLFQYVSSRVVISGPHKWEPPQGKCSRRYETWISLHIAINILCDKCWRNQIGLPFPSSGSSERKSQACEPLLLADTGDRTYKMKKFSSSSLHRLNFPPCH